MSLNQAKGAFWLLLLAAGWFVVGVIGAETKDVLILLGGMIGWPIAWYWIFKLVYRP